MALAIGTRCAGNLAPKRVHLARWPHYGGDDGAYDPVITAIVRLVRRIDRFRPARECRIWCAIRLAIRQRRWDVRNSLRSPLPTGH
jgi:hypothetical protein